MLTPEISEILQQAKAALQVAVTMLFDSHTEDTLKEFSLSELEEISRDTTKLGDASVEGIYRKGLTSIARINAILAGEYYLQDSRSYVGSNMVWWAKDGQGYTTDLTKAHVYTKAEAIQMHRSRELDIPWPKAYVDEKHRRVVDMQVIYAADWLTPNVELTEASEVEYYIQNTTRFDGNDVIWLAPSGLRLTTEINRAEVFTYAAAMRVTSQKDNTVMWPKDYTDSKSRPSVDFNFMDRDTALSGTGIVLTPPPKPERIRYRCHSCGRFLSEVDYYTTPCRACGASNRS